MHSLRLSHCWRSSDEVQEFKEAAHVVGIGSPDDPSGKGIDSSGVGFEPSGVGSGAGVDSSGSSGKRFVPPPILPQFLSTNYYNTPH